MTVCFNSFASTPIFLLAILLRVTMIVTSAGQCPHVINDEIQQCVQPVAEYAKVLNQQQDTAQSSSNSGFGQAIQIGLPKLEDKCSGNCAD
uniref:Uncharacterized protein n=1 Tax=Ditylenchus dipsaci TaxID=166011 RepID=A0A915EBA8_9BILA